MIKTSKIFDRFNNTIGNHMEGKATDADLIKITYEIDKYLLKHPHPHDLVKNNVVLGDVVKSCDHEWVFSYSGHVRDCIKCGRSD